MSVTSGFFNSTNRDRLYNATDFGRFFEGIVTDGVLKDFEDGLEVANLSSLGFQVKPGKAMFNGIWMVSTDLVTLGPAAVTTPDSYGIFAVVAEVNYTTREAGIKLISTADIPSSTTLVNGVQNVLKPLLRNDAARYSGIHQYVMAIGTRNTASVMFSNFAFLTGQTLASSSPYYSIREFIAPYAKAISIDGTIPDPFDYANATNKPSINGVTLSGNKTTEDLGITVSANNAKLLGEAGILTSGNARNLRYNNITDIPTASPKKIVFYGSNPSGYGFRIEVIRTIVLDETTYFPVSFSSMGGTQPGTSFPYIGATGNVDYSYSNNAVTIEVSFVNASMVNRIFETELVW